MRRPPLALLGLHIVARCCAEVTAGDVCDERLFFHQLLAGRDFAVPARAQSAQQKNVFSLAKQMQNFAYIVGDAETREAVVIDPAYDPQGVMATAESLGYNVTACIGTHFHYDHIGHAGTVPFGPGMVLPGVRELVRDYSLPAYIHATERATAAAQVALPVDSLTGLVHGEVVHVGQVALRVLHTPGHSPGSMVMVASVDGENRLAVTGDTVFPGSCGRLDLPGSSVDAMYTSLQQTLGELNNTLAIFPGHAYSGASSTIGAERTKGLLRPMSIERWRRMMAR